MAQYPDHLSGTTLVVDVDTTVFHAFRKGRVGDGRMFNVIKSLFCLQVDSDFTLIKLKWVCSADNKDADDLTRAGAVEPVPLE